MAWTITDPAGGKFAAQRTEDRTPAMGQFVLLADDPSLSFKAYFDETTVKVTDGYGGWEKVTRPRRRSLTVWQGRNGLALQFGFILDNYADGSGLAVERAARALSRMGGVGLGDDEPPLLTLDANGAIPHDVKDDPHLSWVLDDIDWGDSLLNPEGHRVRIQGTLTLSQFIEDQHLSRLSSVQKRRKRKKAAKGKHKKGSKVKRYKVKRGDTLRKIAAKLLGDADRWREIAKLNNIRDPKSLKVGDTLRIP